MPKIIISIMVSFFAYKSIKFSIKIWHKEGVGLVLLFIEDRHRQTPSEKWIRKKQYSHACTIYGSIQNWLYRLHIRQRMSVILSFILPLFEIWRFRLQDKSKKRFPCIFNHFSGRTLQKYVFFQYYALFRNIISFQR